MSSAATDHFVGIEQFEAGLWKIADGLRANSGLASNEYFMPIVGLLFLRHASNRYYAARSKVTRTLSIRPRSRFSRKTSSRKTRP